MFDTTQKKRAGKTTSLIEIWFEMYLLPGSILILEKLIYQWYWSSQLILSMRETKCALNSRIVHNVQTVPLGVQLRISYLQTGFFDIFHLLQIAITPEKNLCLCVAQDLAQYVNEVKRDCETLREIEQYQRSIENLVYQKNLCLQLSAAVRVNFVRMQIIRETCCFLSSFYSRFGVLET